ncbi:MAG TPA: cytochrome c3 family protein [Dehalococcoidia bacterium]|nr:cytochrome c3 family protein [Dehalococcoidia bacterium]
MADGPSPHITTDATTDSCAACHRTHTGSNDNLFKAVPESALCLSCHDGTGASSNVASEYSDIAVPADDPATASYYAHRLDTSQTHISAQIDEFGSTLNRHSACSDCHNPHTVTNALPQETTGGWTASGAQNSITGVNAGMGWQYPVTFEYQLCLKCHSRYTVLLSSNTPTYNKTDKQAELDPTNASYHPVEAPGKNTTSAMQASLNGGKLWQLTTGSTIRCTMCHGNYRLVGSPPTPNSPQTTGQLAPHTSKFRSLLIANYRDRDLKPAGEGYLTNDFDLCYLCHSEAPFSTTSQDPSGDTNFRLHGFHLTSIGGDPAASRDINTAGAGPGNAICAECHFENHSTKFAPWAANRFYSRGVNFGPNVQPAAGELYPFWDPSSNTCTLRCHTVEHDSYDY